MWIAQLSLFAAAAALHYAELLLRVANEDPSPPISRFDVYVLESPLGTIARGAGASVADFYVAWALNGAVWSSALLPVLKVRRGHETRLG